MQFVGFVIIQALFETKEIENYNWSSDRYPARLI